MVLLGATHWREKRDAYIASRTAHSLSAHSVGCWADKAFPDVIRDLRHNLGAGSRSAVVCANLERIPVHTLPQGAGTKFRDYRITIRHLVVLVRKGVAKRRPFALNLAK